jgi:subtilisin family serine protease
VMWDPHLSKLLLEPASLHDAGRRVGVLARLLDPSVPVPHLDVVVRVGQVVTARVDVGRLREVRAHPNVASLKRSLVYFPHEAEVDLEPEAAVGREGADEPAEVRTATREDADPRRWTGRGTVVGFADWGFDVGHADFVDDAGRTRFLLLWDQRGGRTATSPAPYGYGRVWDRTAIDRALRTPDPYAAMGYDPDRFDAAKRGMHGTHTLGIAAGNGRAAGSPRGAASEASIIAVHLRGDDTAAGDSLGDSSRIVEAVDFIFTRARDLGVGRAAGLGDRTPVVVNMSLGRCGGPHDSSPLVVRALDEMLEAAPDRAIVMSAGNYFATDQHASGQLSEGRPLEWAWQVGHPIRHEAEMEVWYAATDVVSLELVDPVGHVVCRLDPGEQHVERKDGQVVVSAFHRPHDPNNGDSVADLFLWPTAPAGVWRVRILPRRVERGVVHAWIERVYGGHQSRFRGADAVFTTNTVCNGRRTIAVAAVDAHRSPPAPGAFSSAGPTRDLRDKPDLAAPGVRITAARSTTVVHGTRRRDGVATMSGTSMAAPHVTGAVAVLLQAAPGPLWASQVRRLLTETASTGAGPRDRTGRGVLDLEAALHRLTDLPSPPPAAAQPPAAPGVASP